MQILCDMEAIMRRKIMSLLLALIMITNIFAIEASATNISDTLTSDLITEEVAEIIASYFVRDEQTLSDIGWTEDTIIADTVTMYGTDGNVSAYSFELETDNAKSGYVVVSAYPDVENIILEFSDESAPIYEELGVDNTDTVVYTGLLNYYKDIGNGQLLSTENISVDIEDVPTPLVDSRSTEYQVAEPYVSYPITDPISWANKYYQGPFKAYEWNNPYESYCKYRVTGNFTGYKSHCGPTAITNLIEMVGGKRNISKITSTNYKTIFKKVADLGISNGYYVNSTQGGSGHSTLNTYIKKSFGLFGVTTSVSSSTVTYDRIKSAIDTNKLFYLSLTNHPYYGNHGVAAFAYNRVKSNTTGYYLSFVKIADGWSSSGRYLDVAGLQNSGSNSIMRVITVS